MRIAEDHKLGLGMGELTLQRCKIQDKALPCLQQRAAQNGPPVVLDEVGKGVVHRSWEHHAVSGAGHALYAVGYSPHDAGAVENPVALDIPVPFLRKNGWKKDEKMRCSLSRKLQKQKCVIF